MTHNIKCNKCKQTWRSEVKLNVTSAEWSKNHRCFIGYKDEYLTEASESHRMAPSSDEMRREV